MNIKSGIVVFILVTIFILPFLILPHYIFLSVDDFCRYDATWDDLLINVGEWLKNHNGRYTNSILSFLPVYQEDTYRFISFFSIILFLIVLYIKSKWIFKKLNLNDGSSSIIIVFIGFPIYLINQLPSIGEFFYWYAGISAYLYSVLSIIILLICLVYCDSLYNKIFVIPFLIIFSIGNMELALVLTNFIILGFVIYQFIRKDGLIFYSLFLFAITIAASLFVIFSEGSAVRLANYTGNQEIVNSFLRSIYSTLTYSFKNLFALSTLLYWVPFFIITNNLKQDRGSFKKFIGFSMYAFLLMCSLFYVVFYSIGDFNSGAGRIGNFFIIIFNLLIFFGLLILPKIKSIFLDRYSKNIVFYMLVGLILLLVSQDYPSSQAWKDIKYGKVQLYKNQLENREKMLRNFKDDVLVIKDLQVPVSLQTPQVLNSPTLERACYEKMIREKYNLNIKKVIFDHN